MYALSTPPAAGRPTRPTRGHRPTRQLPPSRVPGSRVEVVGRVAGPVRRAPRPDPRRAGAATYRRRRLVAAAIAAAVVVLLVVAVGSVTRPAAVPVTERLTSAVLLVVWAAAAVWLWRWDRLRPRHASGARLPAR